MHWLVFIAIGVMGGSITTVAGMGGGLVMVTILALWLDPVTALSVTAIGLLVGNLHRIAMYRRELSVRAAVPLIAGAVPGALAAGLLVTWLPAWLLYAGMAAMAAVAIAKAAGLKKLQLPLWSGVPVGVLTGVATATTGGGGLFVSPWVLSRGLVDAGYIGTVGVIATCLHVARIAAYGSTGAIDADTLIIGGVLAVAIPIGNLVGHRVRTRLNLRHQKVVQLAVLLVCLAMAIIGYASSELLYQEPDTTARPWSNDRATRAINRRTRHENVRHF